MLGIGETEFVLIIVFAFLIFGPDKLPGMGRTLGRALRQFRNAQEGFTQVVQTNIVDPATEAISDNPKKPNRDRAAELAEDADIEGEGGEAPKKVETFAERKKRLAAEKAAAAAAEKAAEAGVGDDEDADADADADDAAETPEAAPAEEKPAKEEPKPRTAADLYAMKRPEKVAEQEAEPEAGDPSPSAQDDVDAPAQDAETEKEAE